MLDLRNIAVGWRKFFKGERPAHFVERAKICMECPHAVDSMLLEIVANEALELPGKKCEICGCGLQQKLMVEEERCPKEKWDVVKSN